MKEAKYQLQKWTTWKRTAQLLEETKTQIQNTTVSIRYDTDDMPGGSHKSIHEKMALIIEEVGKYNDVINVYEFFVNRLEKAVNTLLSQEEKKIVLIYANNETSSQREIGALHEGFPERTYYRILEEACEKLEIVLNPFGSNLAVK